MIELDSSSIRMWIKRQHVSVYMFCTDQELDTVDCAHVCALLIYKGYASGYVLHNDTLDHKALVTDVPLICASPGCFDIQMSNYEYTYCIHPLYLTNELVQYRHT